MAQGKQVLRLNSIVNLHALGRKEDRGPHGLGLDQSSAHPPECLSPVALVSGVQDLSGLCFQQEGLNLYSSRPQATDPIVSLLVGQVHGRTPGIFQKRRLQGNHPERYRRIRRGALVRQQPQPPADVDQPILDVLVVLLAQFHPLRAEDIGVSQGRVQHSFEHLALPVDIGEGNPLRRVQRGVEHQPRVVDRHQTEDHLPGVLGNGPIGDDHVPVDIAVPGESLDRADAVGQGALGVDAEFLGRRLRVRHQAAPHRHEEAPVRRVRRIVPDPQLIVLARQIQRDEQADGQAVWLQTNSQGIGRVQHPHQLEPGHQPIDIHVDQFVSSGRRVFPEPDPQGIG